MSEAPKRPTAYLYIRYSTAEQADGSSFDRQQALAERYCFDHGLHLSKKVFEDLGVSGYSGANLEEGSGLSSFLTSLRGGEIPPGSFLLIETFDRLSRQSAMRSLGLLGEISQLGITVVTTVDGKRYSKENLDTDIGSLLQTVLGFHLANEESRKKSQRLKAAWEKKRADRDTRIVLPMWISRADDGSLVLKEPEASWVREMFALTIEGNGIRRVAKRLEEISGRKWAPSNVRYFLRNRAAIGEYQPFTGRGFRNRKPIGDPIEGFYPAVVSVADFFAAQRTSKPAGRSYDHEVRNLFTGIVKCMECGSSMHLKRASAKDKHERLVCSGQCGAASVQYASFEGQVLPMVDEAFASIADGNGLEERKRLLEIEGELSELKSRRERLLEAIEIGDMPVAELTLRLSSVVAQVATLEREREGLQSKLREASLDRLQEVRELVAKASTLSASTRRRLRSAIAANVWRIEVSKKNGIRVFSPRQMIETIGRFRDAQSSVEQGDRSAFHIRALDPASLQISVNALAGLPERTKGAFALSSKRAFRKGSEKA